MAIISQQVLDDLLSYNETEVRFHIVDPALRKLGYPSDDDVYLKLEEKLEYPYYHIGHKSQKRDLPLGFPDYRAGLKGRRGCFIIEAKSAKAGLSDKDVEQAHSYAAHAKVGANYFMLCDGTRFVVYETLSGSDCKPIVDIPVNELDDRFHELENILSPSSLAKNCHMSYDFKLPLCDGLGSSATIHSGEYNMDDWAYRIFVDGADCTEMLKKSMPDIAEIDDQLAMLEREFELRVADGIAERDSDGRINAHVRFSGVTKNNLEAMKLLGIDNMTFSTNEKYISTDPENPTVFESTAGFALAEGTMFPPLFGDAFPSDTDMSGDIFVTARMHKVDQTIVGEYAASSDYRYDMDGLGKTKLEFDLIGRFTLRLIE